jgi:hypothetical protein
MVYTCANCGAIRGGGVATSDKVWDQCRCGATDVSARPCVEGLPGQEGVPGEHPKKSYRGFLRLGSNGEEDDILFLAKDREDDGEILAELVGNDINLHGNYVAVRYFTADEEMSIDDLTMDLIKQVSGAAEARHRMKYSEMTGYLWTDEDLKVGGHDVLEELKGHVGRFCHLEIEFVGGEKGRNED